LARFILKNKMISYYIKKCLYFYIFVVTMFQTDGQTDRRTDTGELRFLDPILTV
jgi:hypothetical protein